MRRFEDEELRGFPAETRPGDKVQRGSRARRRAKVRWAVLTALALLLAFPVVPAG
jgi:hypothetical protein